MDFTVWLLNLSEVPQFCPQCGHETRRSDRRSCLFSGRALSVSSPANRSMGIVLEVGHSQSAIANGEAYFFLPRCQSAVTLVAVRMFHKKTSLTDQTDPRLGMAQPGGKWMKMARSVSSSTIQSVLYSRHQEQGNEALIPGQDVKNALFLKKTRLHDVTLKSQNGSGPQRPVLEFLSVMKQDLSLDLS